MGAPIQTHNVKRVLANIDTRHGDFNVELRSHGVRLV